MNKSILHTATTCLLLVSAFLLGSCSENSEPSEYQNWQKRNEAYMDSLAQVVASNSDPTLKVITPQSSDINYPIYYKIQKSGAKTVDGTPVQSPYYTSSVSCYYRGYLMNGEEFDGNFDGDSPNTNFESPTTFAVSGVINGWTEALELMVPGDRWRVYIPYTQGYGTTDTSSIPAYSSLIFDVELVKIDY